jgi:hypothetical protein
MLTSRLVPRRKIRGKMASSSSRPSEMARLTVYAPRKNPSSRSKEEPLLPLELVAAAGATLLHTEPAVEEMAATTHGAPLGEPTAEHPSGRGPQGSVRVHLLGTVPVPLCPTPQKCATLVG